ncbi:hypothetical protein [Demequina sediminicola]|uniref:hypothetical protein n=1 Tax=Demequina sediminicola TaxID=1095026 RepID=UPI0007809F51|nr:hypothetical protein [Demequina sediminicola]
MREDNQVETTDRGAYASEYAGGLGDNAVSPSGVPRRLTASEKAREMRRAGLAETHGDRDRYPRT